MTENQIINTVNGLFGDGLKCPNCGARLEQGVSTPCFSCGTRFERANPKRINTQYKYKKPRLGLMPKDGIKKFCENANTVYRTENYSFAYAKRGKAMRFHLEFFGVLKRCAQILLRPFTT